MLFLPFRGMHTHSRQIRKSSCKPLLLIINVSFCTIFPLLFLWDWCFEEVEKKLYREHYYPFGLIRFDWVSAITSFE